MTCHRLRRRGRRYVHAGTAAKGWGATAAAAASAVAAVSAAAAGRRCSSPSDPVRPAHTHPSGPCRPAEVTNDRAVVVFVPSARDPSANIHLRDPQSKHRSRRTPSILI